MKVQKIILGISLLCAVACEETENSTAVRQLASPEVGAFQREGEVFLAEVQKVKEEYIKYILDAVSKNRKERLKILYHDSFSRYVEEQKASDPSLSNMNRNELKKRFKPVFEKIFQETFQEDREKVYKEYERIGKRAVHNRTARFLGLLSKTVIEKELQCRERKSGKPYPRKPSADVTITLNDPAYGSMNGEEYKYNRVSLFKGQNVLFNNPPRSSFVSNVRDRSHVWVITYCPYGESFTAYDGAVYCGESNKSLVIFKSDSHSANFSFPAAGEYRALLVVKDNVSGACAIIPKKFEVGSNDSIPPSESSEEGE